MDYGAIQAAGILARMHKEAAPSATQVAKFIANAPKAVRRSFKEMGKEVTEAMAKGQEPSLAAELAGRAVRYTPHALGLAGIGYVSAPYMRGKVRQFRARQAMTRPYFDPTTQRFM